MNLLVLSDIIYLIGLVASIIIKKVYSVSELKNINAYFFIFIVRTSSLRLMFS